MEAHAVDQWKLGDIVKIPQHKTLQDRIAAAKLFQEENNYRIPLVVDAIDNNFNETFSTWPERGYIIYQGQMAYVSTVNITGSIDWEEGIEHWLQNHFQ